jgi:hypothetical protein
MSTNADNNAEGNGLVVNNGSYLYNGNQGLGLFQVGGTYCALVTGKAWVPGFGSGPAVTPNVWTHLAVVTTPDQGTTFYVDGQVAGTGPSANPVTSGDFAIGYDFYWYGQPAFFQGLIDEVRTFTFAPGTFSTNNLLLNSVPPPPALNLLFPGGNSPKEGGDFILTWAGGTLQHASQLTGPWTPVTGAITPWLVSAVGPSEFFRVDGQ